LRGANNDLEPFILARNSFTELGEHAREPSTARVILFSVVLQGGLLPPKLDIATATFRSLAWNRLRATSIDRSCGWRLLQKNKKNYTNKKGKIKEEADKA
jgi:hypothetical protein